MAYPGQLTQTVCMFPPKSNGGLDLPHLLTVHKKIQATKAGSRLFSRDSSVRAITTLDILLEASLQRILFRPHQEVVEVMKENPGASSNCVVSQVKANIQAVDTTALLAHTTSLPVQGLTVREFEGRAAQNWSSAISMLPEWCFKFALNVVTDTLPHNVNLYKWKKLSSPQCQLCGKHQYLSHVLNSCQKFLDLGRYTTRHDDVLSVIYNFCKSQLPPGIQITADLPGHYNFPQDIAITDQRPDIVIWNTTTIHLLELTIPFETNISNAAEKKVQWYEALKKACSHTHHASIITLRIGSIGFLCMEGLQQLYGFLQAKAKERQST